MFTNRDVSNAMLQNNIFPTPTASPDTQNHIKFNIKCVENHTAALMCVEKKCTQKNIFRCLQQRCICRQNHQKCAKRDADFVYKHIFDKVHNISPFIELVQSIFKTKINEIRQLKGFIIKEIEEKFKENFLFQAEKKFFSLAHGQIKPEQFTTKDSIILSKLVEKQISEIYDFKNVLQSLLNKYSQDTTKTGNQLKRKMVHFIAAHSKYLQQIPEPFYLKQQPTKSDIEIARQIQKSSQILKSKQEGELFTKMFPKKLRRVDYIFRASQNEFSLPKFFDVCGNVTDTVLICKTNKDKIIGGYTPLRHDQDNNNNWASDPKGQSFIFSITEKEKFVLKNNNLAIHRYKDRKYIQFGSAQLAICNKSNIATNCFSDVNHSAYYSPAYTVNDKKAYAKFNGNETSSFTTKDWQIWKVFFHEDEKEKV